MNSIQNLLQAAVERGEIFSARWGIGQGGRLRFSGGFGGEATIYDLASLTKPLVTGLLAVILRERGMLDFEAPVGAHLDEFDRSDKRGVLVRHLLTHSAGFPAWKPFYALADRPEDVLSVIAATPLGHAPGTDVVYSDFGFLALGFLLERLTGKRLDMLFDEEIAQPLGLTETCFNPPAASRNRIAPTEIGNAYERGLAATVDLSDVERRRVETYSGWRTAEIRGEVHDGNAYFLGGVAGHAGLFGTVAEVFRIASQFLPGSALLRDESLELFSRNFTPGSGKQRSIAWMLAASPQSSAGSALPPDAFGHTGFSGTSVWADPRTTRIYVLLANRAYPIVDLNPTRHAFHALSHALLEGIPDA